MNLRRAAALGWIVLTMGVAAYAVLKTNPSAGELPGLPTAWAAWLDWADVFRTFLMTVSVIGPAATAVGTRQNQRWRWGIVGGATAGLTGLEFAQIWLPTRVFDWGDIAWTLAGGVAAEILARIVQVGDRSIR